MHPTSHHLLATASRAVRFMQPAQADDVAAFVYAQQHADGGFRGRSAASDVYYTVFGLSSLSALGHPWSAAALRDYLELLGDGASLDGVHLASAIRCWAALAAGGDGAAAVRGRLMLQRLEAYRTADGGYHHQTPHAARGSVYGAFLAFLAHAESGVEMARPHELLAGLAALRTGDGGYANVPEVPLATTTATAAALLVRFWMTGEVDGAAADALRACAQPQGGFLAAAQAPGADLLATATALHALHASGLGVDRADAHLAFVESLWADNGGFRGHPADRVTDCEYTFYALLAIGACWMDD